MNYRQRQALNTALGHHPTGLALGPAGETCGSCANHFSREWDKVYHKCALMRDTAGPASDIRVRWPACDRWKRREG